MGATLHGADRSATNGRLVPNVAGGKDVEAHLEVGGGATVRGANPPAVFRQKGSHLVEQGRTSALHLDELERACGQEPKDWYI